MNQTKAFMGSLRRGAKALLGGLCLLGALWASPAGLSRAFAANPARLNINVSVEGIALITDVTAKTGSATGSINLTWTEPGRNQTIAPYFYDIRVSTTGEISNNAEFDAAQPLSAFSPSLIPAPGAAGAETGFVVTGLTPGLVHYFAIRLSDSNLPPHVSTWLRLIARGFNIDNFAAAKSPIDKLPMEPFGFKISHSSGSFSVTWTPTTRFEDGQIFHDTVNPGADELEGYSISRSTELCSFNFVQIASNTISDLTFNDSTGGSPYFYKIRSYNTVGLSTNTLIISSLGVENYYVDDCVSRVVVPPSQAPYLVKGGNTMGGDIRIVRVRRPQDVGQGVIQSVQWKALLNGVTELRDFHFPNAVQVILHYITDGSGHPIPQTAPVGSLVVGVNSVIGAPLSGSEPLDPKNLGMYWQTGSGFKKMYGDVDNLDQVVSVQSPNLGIYQIRALFREAGAVFDVSNLSSKVITPNGDGLNDVMIFTYDPGPNHVVPEGTIYDLHGAVVAQMTPGAVPNTLTWDGKSGGRVVTSGVYVYQIKGDGKTFNGTVVVAR